MNRPEPLPFYLSLAGPTASGKTAAALALAQAWARTQPVEIVSVDSALVYRGLDIGTAKPSLAERAQVPHHLIDVIEPHEAFSAAQFAQQARRLITDIHGRGALPLLVGGTSLYFKALWDGLDELPPSEPAVRAHWQAQHSALGTPALHAQLAQLDAPTAARLSPHDTQRVMRALEVHTLTGRPLSAFHQRQNEPPRPAPPVLCLTPSDRSVLHARIADRYLAMLRQGLVQEVERCRHDPRLHPDLPAMRCVGYRQTWTALEAGLDPHSRWPEGPLSAPVSPALRHCAEAGIAATRQLAKRQITWLRSWPERHTVDALLPPAQRDAQVLAWARALMESPRAGSNAFAYP